MIAAYKTGLYHFESSYLFHVCAKGQCAQAPERGRPTWQRPPEQRGEVGAHAGIHAVDACCRPCGRGRWLRSWPCCCWPWLAMNIKERRFWKKEKVKSFHIWKCQKCTHFVATQASNLCLRMAKKKLSRRRVSLAYTSPYPKDLEKRGFTRLHIIAHLQ